MNLCQSIFYGGERGKLLRTLCGGVSSGMDKKGSKRLDEKEGGSVWCQDLVRSGAMSILQFVIESITVFDVSLRLRRVRVCMKEVWKRTERDAKEGEGMKQWREVKDVLSEEDVCQILTQHGWISTLPKSSKECRDALTALESL